MLTPRFLCKSAVALAAIAAGAQDQDGAADPDGIVRFPDSRIVAYTPPTPLRGYEFVTGRVDRSQRDRRIDSSRRVAAELVRVTYQAPAGTRHEDVIDHYQSLVADLRGEIAFTCRGRDCGRSTVWANDVFGVKELVAPDSAQFYLAAAVGDRLLAIYVVQRGNRRVYAHVDVAHAEGDRAKTMQAGGVVDLLARQGYAVLADALPSADGALGAAALAALAAHAGQLAPAPDRTLHVVCHLPGTAAVALAQSSRCAERAAAALREAGVEAAPFGAGPLLPRLGSPAARIELVAP